VRRVRARYGEFEADREKREGQDERKAVSRRTSEDMHTTAR
jgi:hypothetical protein